VPNGSALCFCTARSTVAIEWFRTDDVDDRTSVLRDGPCSPYLPQQDSCIEASSPQRASTAWGSAKSIESSSKWGRLGVKPAGIAARALSPLACRQSVLYILYHMVQYAKARLDDSFAALSDATRRGVLEQLGRADASITDLAEKFHMTLTGMKKHVGVLEQVGLVTTEKVGRVRTCRLGRRRLEEETAWIERYRQLWDARFDELDEVIEELKLKEKIDGRKK
jgi:DNA-binding transcriptional ArsR family regulator